VSTLPCYGQFVPAKNLLHQVQHREGMNLALYFSVALRPPESGLARQLPVETAEALQSHG